MTTPTRPVSEQWICCGADLTNLGLTKGDGARLHPYAYCPYCGKARSDAKWFDDVLAEVRPQILDQLSAPASGFSTKEAEEVATMACALAHASLDALPDEHLLNTNHVSALLCAGKILSVVAEAIAMEKLR